METLDLKTSTDEKTRAEDVFENFENAKRRIAKGVMSNASIIVGIFIIWVAIAVLTTDIYITSFLNFATIGLVVFVIFFASYIMFLNTSGAGGRAGLESSVYKNAKLRHEHLREEIIVKKAIGKIPEFCRSYVARELRSTREDILAKVDIDYSEYSEKYLGKDKKSIKSDMTLSETEKNTIIAANEIAPVKLTADMIFKSKSGRRNREPLSDSPSKRRTTNYIVRFVESLAFAVVPAIVVLEVSNEFTWASVAAILFKLAPIIAHAFYGYESGYKLITVTTVEFLDSQSDLMQEFLHWLEKENALT